LIDMSVESEVAEIMRMEWAHLVEHRQIKGWKPRELEGYAAALVMFIRADVDPLPYLRRLLANRGCNAMGNECAAIVKRATDVIEGRSGGPLH